MIILLVKFVLLAYTVVSSREAGCPERDFIGCVLRLRTQRVPFDKNILNVVFNVTSEAKLLHTCRAYGDVVPCFRDKIVRCGDDKQRRLLEEVRRMLMFFCSPFSLSRQREFIKYGNCIGQILQLPATTGCKMIRHTLSGDLDSCRSHCSKKREFICLMKTWVTEQSICTLIDIERKCGRDAAFFYTDLQKNVFEEKFPIICDKEPISVRTTTPAPSTAKTVNPFRPYPFLALIPSTPATVTGFRTNFSFTASSPASTFYVTQRPIAPFYSNTFLPLITKQYSTYRPYNTFYYIQRTTTPQPPKVDKPASQQWRPWYLTGRNFDTISQSSNLRKLSDSPIDIENCAVSLGSFVVLVFSQLLCYLFW